MTESSEHVRALQEEISMLRQRVAQKDETINKLQDEMNSQTAVKQDRGTEVYPVLETTFRLAQRGSAATKNLLVIGPLIKFGIRVADVGVRRLTPWNSCAEMEQSIASAVPYIDEKFISPQINAYREVTLAVLTPPIDAAREALVPYYGTAQAYAGRVSEAAQPVIITMQPYVVKIESIARPLVCEAWKKLRPWIRTQAVVVQEAIEDVNAKEADFLKEADPDAVYEKIYDGANLVADFVNDHKADFVNDVSQISNQLQHGPAA